MTIELIIFMVTVVVLFIIYILSNRVWYRKSLEQERVWSELTRKMIREWNNNMLDLESRITSLEDFVNTIREVIDDDSSL